MNQKLKTGILYQLVAFLKALGIFYACTYTVVLVSLLLIANANGNMQGAFSGLEISSFVFLAFCSVYTFTEDFKLFIQNGMTRNMIFKSLVCGFLAISFLLAFLDTIMAQIILVRFDYRYMFQMIYGDNPSILLSFVWLFLLYFILTLIVYVITLVLNRVGKKIFLVSSICIATVLSVITPTINIMTEGAFLNKLMPFLARLLGFVDGGINYMYPICTFVIFALVSIAASYLFTKKAQI